MGFDEIVFVKRKPYSSDHYYTDINNGTSPDRFLPDNGIYIYNLRTRSERPVVTAADLPGGKGFIGKISLSFDAKKVLFDFRQDPGSGFRIWEVNIDGTGLRQVSFPPADEAEKAARWHPAWHTDDIHPCYLPDGKIIFSSTRCEHTVLCGGSAHLVAPGLHRMDADGTHVEQLTHSPVSEFCPVVLDDGRVMYHRWEYIDKGARVAKTDLVDESRRDPAPGTLRPGRRRHDRLHVPAAASRQRSSLRVRGHVPLSARRLPGGDPAGRLRQGRPRARSGSGRAGLRPGDDRYPVVNITPARVHPAPDGAGLAFPDRQTASTCTIGKASSGHLYTHPYPVSDREFLVSYKVNAAGPLQGGCQRLRACT